MKILNVSQIRTLDQQTIEREGIRSVNLMERAGQSFCDWFINVYTPEDGLVSIFVGLGNNGGDGLVIARILSKQFFEVRLVVCELSEKKSEDFQENFDRLPKDALQIIKISEGDEFPIFDEPGIIIDAILGTGISRPLDGYWGALVSYLNEDLSERIAVDIPSGMFADEAKSEVIFDADCTFTFEIPKLAFLLPSYLPKVGKLVFGHIGLNREALFDAEADYYLVTEYLAASILKERPTVGHKGTFGHALLVMGSYGKMGAAILASRACLRSGTGLVTTHLPSAGYAIMEMAFPEAMVSVDPNEFTISQFPETQNYKAIGIGCGIGTEANTQKVLTTFLQNQEDPILLDADALNIIALNPGLENQIPRGSILTPHPGEFQRLFGSTANDFDQLELLKKKSIELQVFILLKGARSCLACPNGQLFFNTTGNSGMATAGSGDVLSGMITGLMAQGYSVQEAGILGMYLHGSAGDAAATETLGEEAMIASDIIDNIGTAFVGLHEML